MMTEGGGGQKSQKNDDIFYERPLTRGLILTLVVYQCCTFIIAS